MGWNLGVGYVMYIWNVFWTWIGIWDCSKLNVMNIGEFWPYNGNVLMERF